MLSAGRTLALVGGILLVLAAVIGAASLLFGLVLGIGAIVSSGHLKHRIWSAMMLVGAVIVFLSGGGIVVEGGAILILIAAALGLTSTFV